MQRKFKAIVLAVALSASTGAVVAQDFVFSWNPRTGDVWVDNQLNDINQYGYRYREPFIDEMTRYYGAPRDLVHDLVVNQRWAPGDVYYACSLAQVIGRPCAYVVEEWRRDNGQGWGVVAQRLGIKPGSAEFHRLKKGFVPTYDRWARPIGIDRDLVVDFPDRGKGPKGTHASFSHGKSKTDKGANGKGSSVKGRDGKSRDHTKAAKAEHPGHSGNARKDSAGKGKDASGKGNARKDSAGKGKDASGKGNAGKKAKGGGDGKGKG